MAIPLGDLRCYRNLLGHGPHKARQFPSHGHDHLVGVFAAGHQAANAFTQPHLGLPTDVLDWFRERFQPALQVATDFGGIPVGPGPFDQGAAGRGVAGFGDRTLPASLPTRIFGGDQPQAFHQLSGVLEAGEVSQFRHGGDGHGKLDATQGLERFDDRM
jgi:hypothetical protein